MYKRPSILEFIRTIRESFEGSEYVYRNGSCYYFAKILQAIYPEGELWEFPQQHVLFKLDEKFYDIRGEVGVADRDIRPSEEPTPHGKFSLFEDVLFRNKY